VINEGGFSTVGTIQGSHRIFCMRKLGQVTSVASHMVSFLTHGFLTAMLTPAGFGAIQGSAELSRPALQPIDRSVDACRSAATWAA
jgi:predicted RNA binding protein YcfA (HicA-like mRNA interferase family)